MPGGPAVTRLTLTRFRNYETLRLDVAPRPVVLTGPNGAGKTNLLEALSFLSPGRGLRRAGLSEVSRRSQGPAVSGGAVSGGADSGTGAPEDDGRWAVAAQVTLADGPPLDLGTGRDPGPSDRRVVRIDGSNATQAALGEVLSILWLTPDMDGLFRDGATARRRFLDRLVHGLDPAHVGRTSAYAHAMRERARLLKERRGALRAVAPWLDGLEEQMARHGVAVAAARRDLIERLGAAMAAAVGPFPQALLSLSSRVGDWLSEGPALAAEDRLRAALAASRPRDADAGGAAEGPHRDDLAVRHRTKGVDAAMASTGEQKALLIALLLAQARVQAKARGAPPVLLLDEVAAHLDADRRAALAEALTGLGAQAWMTGTDHQAFDAWQKTAQFLRIEGAAVLR